MDYMPKTPYLALFNKMSKDMSFVGLMSIIFGVFFTLTIVLAVLGIPMIFAGIQLRESANIFKNYAIYGEEDLLQKANEELERYFYINKILWVISLALIILPIIVCLILHLLGLPCCWR
jgi:hypothetical protein